MASAMPDLRLLSRPQTVTAH